MPGEYDLFSSDGYAFGVRWSLLWQQTT